MSKVTWSGVYPAMLTPFTHKDEVDVPLFLKNLEAQVKAGVDGIILGGSLGEASSLSNEEKTELLRHSREYLSGSLPIIVNIAEQTTKGAIKVAEDAATHGADGLMLLPPMRYKADERETLTYFRTVAQATDLPVMIYNNPVDYKIHVTLDMFEAMSDIATIQAVKESTRDISNVIRMVNRFGDRFKILCGVDTLAYESLCAGAHGWVAGLVDAFPRETVALYRLVRSGRHAEALAIYRWFLPVLELDIHPKLVQYIKMAAARTGIGSELVRAPRLIPEGAERKEILSIIDEALATRPTLPDYLRMGTTKTIPA